MPSRVSAPRPGWRNATGKLIDDEVAILRRRPDGGWHDPVAGASGLVNGRVYDLADPADRRRVYEVVFREGPLQDFRRYVDVRKVTEQFD